VIWNSPELFEAAFANEHFGYRRDVTEIPNGDGVSDTGKRFAHVATKYGLSNLVLREAFWTAMALADETAAHWGLALDPDACALRVLEYPAGAGSAWHTDFDLFTVNLWRSHPELMRQEDDWCPKGVHFGELFTLLVDKNRKATGHYVESHPTERQRSVVFFALPSHKRRLPGGGTVGTWLEERIARSRTKT
jgi:hypothetical protein